MNVDETKEFYKDLKATKYHSSKKFNHCVKKVVCWEILFILILLSLVISNSLLLLRALDCT